jgi:hypothetical protein
MSKSPILKTNALEWHERMELKKYAMAHDYFPDRNYRFMTLTDFVKEFLRRLREGKNA